MNLALSLKRVLFGIVYLLTLPIIALCWLEKSLTSREGVFQFFAQFVALIPGYPGYLIRAAFYVGTLQDCSWEVHIGFGSIFTHRGVRVGSRVSTGVYCVLGHVDIGNKVRLASRVSVPSGKRQHLDSAGRMTDATHFDTVKIGAHAWIGESSVVLDSVGEHAIICAGAVVVNEVPARAVVGGNPAKFLKSLEIVEGDD